MVASHHSTIKKIESSHSGLSRNKHSGIRSKAESVGGGSDTTPKRCEKSHQNENEDVIQHNNGTL